MSKRAGKMEQMEDIYHKYYDLLVNVAYQILKSREDSRGIVQEVFVNVWDKREELELTSVLKAYLIRSTRNRSINAVKARYNSHSELDAVYNVGIDADQDNIELEKTVTLEDRINSAIATLPEKCQEIFMMSRMDGLSYKEIAQVLEISPKTVENQISIALKKLRIILADLRK